MSMAIICDIVSCRKIIEDKVHDTNINGKMYHLCVVCFDGLLKFIKQNLQQSDRGPVKEISQKQLSDINGYATVKSSGYASIHNKDVPSPGWSIGLSQEDAKQVGNDP